MTAILTPWYRRGPHPVAESEHGSLSATRILDLDAPGVRALVAEVRGASPVETLGTAHAAIRDRVRPVYALDESTPVSMTLARGAGSCSQRLAVLESVARSIGVPTRVRGLLIDRSFWFPRFPRLRFALPDELLLAWPEFRIDGGWRSASELFGPIGCHGGPAFANSGADTLFEAAGRCAIDWDGTAGTGVYDLSRFVRADLGTFADRDALFARFGQSLCRPSRMLADPVMRRISA